MEKIAAMGSGRDVLAPAELVEVITAERARVPFLTYRDDTGALRLRRLARNRVISIGRLSSNGLVLDWDPEISRVHARLERHGDVWTLVDDGLSRNGTFVAGERIAGRRRLRDGDTIQLGRTTLQFRAPGIAAGETASAEHTAALVALTEAERRVLEALCRPVVRSGRGAAPPTNRQLAEELHLSIDGVKARVRALFAKLEVPDLPQNQKRAELIRRALQAGLISGREATG
jgi:pSer/pThr/pTyr-binding forkhead associated (FHA) protein